MSRRLAVCLLAAALSAGGAARAEAPVTLTFAWPEGMDSVVSYRAERVRVVEGARRRQVLTGTYAFRTSAVEDGLLVDFRDFRFQLEGTLSEDGARTAVQRFLLTVGNTLPDYVVSPEGKVLRVVGLDELQANMMRAMSELTRNLPAQTRERIDQVMEAALSRRQLEASIASYWNRDVGPWAGATLERGAVYESSYRNPVPALGNAEIPMKLTYRYLGPSPCREGGPADACVHLEMRSFVDTPRVAEAMDRFIKRLADGAAGDFAVDKLTVDTTVRLITEPDTLVPHRVESVRNTSMVVTRDGASVESGQSETRTISYRH